MPTDPGNTVLQLAALSQVSALQEISALLKELLDSKKSPDTTPSNSRRDGSSKTSSELSLLGHADEDSDPSKTVLAASVMPLKQGAR